MKKWLSANSILIIASVFILIFGFESNRWAKQKIIDNDVAIYYAYLPAALIYHDLTFEFTKNIPPESKKKIWTIYDHEKNIRILKMPMGVAILHTPFFAVGHVVALLSDFKADGYTPPYQAAVFFSTLFYVLFGLFFLRKLLNRHFSGKITNWTLIIIILGTNLFYYSSVNPGMSHPYSFIVITAFLYFTELWHEKANWKRSFIVGLLFGFIVLIRPSNIISVFVFLLYGVYSKAALKTKIDYFRKNYLQLILITVISLIIVSPQVIYWKLISGDWYYYTYGDEGFFFNDPKFINGLFSFRKGWLIYTPIMTFSLIGMLYLRRKKEYLIAIPLTTLFALYIIFSWWAWWYGGGFSSRPMIDYYGLLAIPLALFIHEIFSGKKILKAVFLTIILLLISLNIWQSYQYKKGILHYDGMTKEAYIKLFFAKHYPKNYNEIIDRPDYKMMKQNVELSQSDYEKQLSGKELKFYRFCTVSQIVRKSLRGEKILPGESIYSKLLIIIKNKESYPEYYDLIVEKAKRKIEKRIKHNDKKMSRLIKKANQENTTPELLVKNHADSIFNKKFIEN